jgi:hypothetical protein
MVMILYDVVYAKKQIEAHQNGLTLSPQISPSFFLSFLFLSAESQSTKLFIYY